MFKPSLITFDGIDGCGKTTQVKLTADYLKEIGVPCVVTDETRSNAVGADIVTNVFAYNLHPSAEMYLFLAARAQHERKTIGPAIEKGCVVLCDRFNASTYAYQCHNLGFPLQMFLDASERATRPVYPSLQVIYDCEPTVALRRLKRGQDAIERRGYAYFNRANEGFKEYARQMEDYTCIIRTDVGTQEQVFANTIQAVLDAIDWETQEG